MANKFAVIAYEKGYRVNDEGQVVAPRGNIRALTVDADGYYRFSLGHNGSTRVHSLAAIQWFGDYDESLEIRHLDGNPKNNARSNLALGTRSQNEMDKSAAVRQRVAARAASKQRKFTETTVAEIRMKWAQGATLKQLIAEYGGAKSTISYIVNNKMYTNTALP